MRQTRGYEDLVNQTLLSELNQLRVVIQLKGNPKKLAEGTFDLELKSTLAQLLHKLIDDLLVQGSSVL